MSASSPALGPIALGVHVGAALITAGLPAALYLQRSLSGPSGLCFAVLGLTVTGLSLFQLASSRRRHHVLERQVPASGRQAVAALKGELKQIERRLTRTVRDAVFDPYKYWEDRAARMGASAVGDVGWDKEAWDAETAYDLDTVVPFFKEHLPQPSLRILDFGCGVGRFTSALAALTEEGAVGVDATASLLAIADKNKTHDKASFVQARGQLPFPDNHFDGVWVAYVMIHIIGDAKARVAEELLRVLKPGGQIFITEGVNTWRTGSAHCDFVSVDRYREIFGLPLKAYRRTDLEPMSDETLAQLMPELEAKNEDLHLIMTSRTPVK